MALLHLFLAVLAILAKEVRCQCPNPLFQQSCYIIPHTEANWTDAERYCQDVHGHLATIESAEEHNFIANLIRSRYTVQNLTLNTPNKYKYRYLDHQGLNVYGHTSITFTVQACNDAHVALSAGPVSTEETYEVVIGGWGNSRSVIRDCMQCAHMDERSQHLLDCNNTRPFWLSWQDGHIRVGTGLTVGENQVLSWQDPQPHAVNHVGVSTGWGSSGVWHFNIPVQSLTLNTPNKYKYRYLDHRGLNVYGHTSIIFTVQACNDAHVALSAGPVSTEETYEVVIGGWGNSQSVIRDCMQCAHMDERRQQLLDCNNPRPFWLSWQDGRIRVGTGLTVGENQVLNWQDPQPHAVNHVGVSTGWGSSGVWHFNIPVQSLTLNTPNKYKYRYLDQGLNVYGHTSITFTVQACNDAHVALSAGPVSTEETYEVVIGGWGNSQSVIRDCMQCAHMDEWRQHLLDCNNTRPFWLSWQDGHIRVGTGLIVGENKVLSWQDPQPHAVNHVGVSTGWGSSGVWHFNIGQVPVQSLTLNTPSNYKYRYLDHQGLNVYGHTSITFTVQACNDAHVALSAGPVSTEETYEVVIGGWSNSKSVIRDCMQCAHMDERSQQLLDCNNPRPFWLSWQDGHIRVGTGLTVGENQVLNWQDPQPHAVYHVGISTGWGSSGVWHFNIGAYRPGVFWLGSTDAQVKGEWKNLPDMQEIVYTQWAQGKPSNAASHHCAAMDGARGLDWINANCQRRRNFICEL